MSYSIIDSSPQVLAKITNFEDAIGVSSEPAHHRSKYPWAELSIGKSFCVPIGEANEGSLRNGAAAFNKRTGKKLTVIRHANFGCFEVARVG